MHYSSVFLLSRLSFFTAGASRIPQTLVLILIAGKMRLLGLFVVTLLSSVSLFGQLTGSDNFDDNTLNSEAWLEIAASGDGLLQEVNSRLEFTGTGTSSQYRYWNNASYDADFEIILQIANSTIATAGTFASVGVEIYPSGATNPVFNVRNASYYVTSEAYTGPSRDILANFFDGATLNPALPAQPLIFSATVVGMRIFYESDTAVLTISYDMNVSDGYQWTELSSFGLDGDTDGTYNQDFGITSGTDGAFEVAVYGSTFGIEVASGELYADAFEASQTLTFSAPTPNILPAMIVEFESQFGATYVVEKSTSLESGPFFPLHIEDTGTVLRALTPTTEKPANTITGTGETFQVVDDTSGQSEAFYRISLQE
jgi:hypothetical protein